LTFAEAPLRVIATGQGAVELLIQLGEKQALIGHYYGQQAPVAEELRSAFESVPTLSNTAPPSKEISLALKPDLVVAQFPTADLDPSRGGASQADFENAGAQVFLYSATSGDPSMAKYDLFLDDVIALGKIFRTEARAQSLAKEARNRLASARAQSASLSRPKIAIVFAGSDQTLGVFGSGMLNDLFDAANVENVYAHERESLIQASREDFASRGIECYVIPDFPDTPGRRAELTFEWLTRTFPELPASKQRCHVAISVEKLNVGLRNVEAVEQLVREIPRHSAPNPANGVTESP
jgi:iron complex transport system substrate-binding protein